jgi:hypothetical protein
VIIAKLIKRHSRRCTFFWFAKKELLRWYLNTREGLKSVDLDAAGGRRGKGFRWIKFECPDLKCGAHGIVRVDSIEEAITEALQAK